MMPIILSDLDLEAMETINYTIDQIMTLDDAEYIAASEKVLGIVHQYLSGLMLQQVNSKSHLIFIPEGGRA
jgi:hypothetical protein